MGGVVFEAFPRGKVFVHDSNVILATSPPLRTIALVLSAEDKSKTNFRNCYLAKKILFY